MLIFLIIFYLFALFLIYQSYRSFVGGLEYLKYFKKELSKPRSNFTPCAAIFAPCRGRDENLKTNLAALFYQDYPEYEIIFVTDDAGDPCVSVIEELRAEFEHLANVSSKLVIAGLAADEGQKVHNLRAAVPHASEKSAVFAFVDSDARPGKDWLRDLVAPLEDEKIGAAAGYRWFISKKRNFSSELQSVWNASVASALGANMKSNFCWGGSTAILRKTFENIDMREKWRGTLSDDFAVTRAVKGAGLLVYFVPQCLTASIEDCDFRGLLEFTTRQMKITRVYAPQYWKMSFAGSFVFNTVFISGILLMISGAAFWQRLLALVALVLASLFSIGKSWLRLNAVKLVLNGYEKDLKKQFWTQNTLWIISPALFFYNCAAALVSRKIVWRGITYELKSPQETLIHSNDK
ncbi:MAG TPA: glycosyltransferase family 2 protein [Pyrinomonadaceae bacterium]|jgi:cellulose synthase/poly-beta-1,6-N-acetylglucosamine synthase-like glycosyltransferase|nr:glycosyltransferase family 2 protein [Pyrinomonadaceae bacterium]